MRYAAFTIIVLILTVACGTVAPPIPKSAESPIVFTGTPAPNTPVNAPSGDRAAMNTPPATRNLTPAPGAAPLSSALPSFSHIYIIMMENQEYSSVVGSPNAPYLNSLFARYGLAVNYTGVSHPSEPNYLALFSGSTHGITDDAMYNLPGSHLGDQMDAKGKTWKIFAQNVPLNCYTGSSASGGEDGPGTYARKHNPAISFTNISSSPARCRNITNFSHFDPAAADLELIVPNMCNVMHDCPVKTGDDFLKSFVPRILDSAAWQQEDVLFITWDEGSTNSGGGGHIPTLVISRRVPPSFQSAIPHNHYSLLRTIQDAWGLGCLENSCSANILGEFFK